VISLLLLLLGTSQYVVSHLDSSLQCSTPHAANKFGQWTELTMCNIDLIPHEHTFHCQGTFIFCDMHHIGLACRKTDLQ